MGHTSSGRRCDLPVYQWLLQPAPTSLIARWQKPLGIRTKGRINEFRDRNVNATSPHLTEGRTEAQHVIVDAAYDADYLGAMAHIKRNPPRRKDRPVDWLLYKERHLVKCFYNKSNTSAASPCSVRRQFVHSKPSSIALAQWRRSVKCRGRLKHLYQRMTFFPR